MPVMEHPFYGSWGYQVTGYFAPTTPLRHAARTSWPSSTRLHQRGIGVILDWVPVALPDRRARPRLLRRHAPVRARRPAPGFHPDWSSCIFNYGRHEVRSFLLASAIFWLERYHTRRPARGRRGLDALPRLLAPERGVATEPSRRSGEPGGHRLPAAAERRGSLRASRGMQSRSPRSPRRGRWCRGRSTWAASASATSGTWAGCTTPSTTFTSDPVHRKYHHDRLTFRAAVRVDGELHPAPLPRRGRARQGLAHGQDAGRRLAALRQPAPALRLSCGPTPARSSCSWAASSANRTSGTTRRAWSGICSTRAVPSGLSSLVRDLNRLYRGGAAAPPARPRPGRLPVDGLPRPRPERDRLRPVRARAGADAPLRCNFTPVPVREYRVGVPRAGTWAEVLNTDSAHYGGSNLGNGGGVRSEPVPWHGQSHSICLTLPPLAAVWLRFVEA